MSTTPEQCFLCGDTSVRPEWNSSANHWWVRCTLCGEYGIDLALAGRIMSNREQELVDLQPYLSAHARQADARSQPVTFSADNYLSLAAAHKTTPVATKLRRVLEHLQTRSPNPGHWVTWHAPDYPLFDCVNAQEYQYLGRTLEDQGDITTVAQEGGAWRIVITAKGWERLQPSAPGGVPGAVFVAMAYADDLEAAYDAAIQPAVVQDCGLTINHVGRVQHNDSIDDVILAGLMGAQVVIADVTHQRNGVYFEAGFGMGLGRTVIWMCRADDKDNIHFDTRQFSHIFWTDHDDLRVKLRNRLRGTVNIPARMP
jgi:hypothetical protein